MWALLQLSLRECSLCIKNTGLKRSVCFIFLINICIGIFEKFLVIFKFVFMFGDFFSEYPRDSPVVYKQQCPVWKWIKNYSVVWLWGGEGPQTRLAKGVTGLGCSLLACWEIWLSCHSLIDCSHMPSALMHIKIMGTGGRRLTLSCWDP